MKAIAFGRCAALIAALRVRATAEETAEPYRFKNFPAKVYKGRLAQAQVRREGDGREAGTTALQLFCVVALLGGSALPASATCEGALARLIAGDGRSFVADRYGTGSYGERTGRGRLTYSVHVWHGRLGKDTRFLHFTEIPGTSGPNWGSEGKLSEYKARIVWKPSSTFALPREFTIYAGPLKGGWTTACDSARQ